MGTMIEDAHGHKAEVIFEGTAPVSKRPYRLSVHYHPDDNELTYGCEVLIGLDTLGNAIWLPWGRVDEFLDQPIQGDVVAAIIEALVEAKDLLPEWAAEIQHEADEPPKGPDWVAEVVNGNEA